MKYYTMLQSFRQDMDQGAFQIFGLGCYSSVWPQIPHGNTGIAHFISFWERDEWLLWDLNAVVQTWSAFHYIFPRAAYTTPGMHCHALQTTAATVR